MSANWSMSQSAYTSPVVWIEACPSNFWAAFRFPDASRTRCPAVCLALMHPLGPVVFRDGDYFGRVVNTAARMTDYARPGEVLVSEAVVESGAAEGSAFEELGVVELKGIREPVRLFRAIPATQSRRSRSG